MEKLIECGEKNLKISRNCIQKLEIAASKHIPILKAQASYRTNHKYDLIERIKRYLAPSSTR